MATIVDIQLDHLKTMLEDRKVSLELDSAARNWLADTGYDPVYGARPLKRVIQTHLQNPRATMVLEGTIQGGETV
jgi:ATP-dependent Clp protease ATP-binding subunit ClpB